MPVTLVRALVHASLWSASLAAMVHAEAKPAFCHNLDCPAFTTLEKTDDFELRAYEPAKWASTIVTGYDFKQAQRTGFWRLFKYIGGANTGSEAGLGTKKGEKIAMTAPVRTLVTPSDGPYCESNFTVSFYLPDEYQEKPPEPENDKVFIETTPTIEVFVASFGGWNSQDKFTKAAAKLHATLRDGGRSVSDGAYYTAGYDSPFRLTNRHNEVWLVKDDQGVNTAAEEAQAEVQVGSAAERLRVQG